MDGAAVAWVGAGLGSYLLGAVPFALLVGRLRGIDLREHGSGNLGATNALRVLGKAAGSLVLALDALKGLLPVVGAGPLLASAGLPAPAWLPVVLGLLAILGHVFPVYLGFRGGKGVATSAGVCLALHPAAFVAALAVFAAAVGATRLVSLGSLLAAAALPAAAVLLDGPALAFGEGAPRTGAFLLAAALVVARHRANVRRLLAGTEPRLGATPPPPAPQPAPHA